MSFDPTRYYQLTHKTLGPNQALDVNPDGSGRLMMASTGSASGQSWQLADLPGSRARTTDPVSGRRPVARCLQDRLRPHAVHGSDRGRPWAGLDAPAAR